MAIQIFVDSDACPVKDEVIKVALRYGLMVTFVSNQPVRPSQIPSVRHVVVGAGFDAADDWIVEQAGAGDIVVTSDIPLAARCLDKACKVTRHDGRIFTSQNIGGALASRDLSAHLRETGESKGYNPSFSKKNRSQFLQSLDLLIQKSVGQG